MKRVKFMLVAITMVAAVGGTLAFKASKISLQKAYTCNANSVCDPLPNIQNVTTTVKGQAQSTITDSYTITTVDVSGLPCTNLTAPCTKAPSTFIKAEF
jgi:hypothetical protein